MCLEAINKGYLRVDAEAGRAYAVRKAGRLVGCKNVKGYIVFTLHLAGMRKQIKLHRLIWIAANGLPPKEAQIDHVNRIKDDNRIQNLRLADGVLNSNNRRSYKGDGNPACKINGDTAIAIREAHKELKSYAKVANKFDVSRSLVAQIVRRELWV